MTPYPPIVPLCKHLLGNPHLTPHHNEAPPRPSELFTAQPPPDSPWRKDPTYFQKAYISPLAATKMAVHAALGGDIEVMGMMVGRVVGNSIAVLDLYALPVVGTETRVNAAAESYEYMVSYLDLLSKTGIRDEHIVGWYHSHPGYGCWLSGIDVDTQALNQQHQDPYLAVVIDPKKTSQQGFLEIGAFRTVPVPVEGFKATISDLPEAKLADFGAHAAQYYSLEVKVFRSEQDDAVLRLLRENFWILRLTGLGDDNSFCDLDKQDASDARILKKLSERVTSHSERIEKIAAQRTAARCSSGALKGRPLPLLKVDPDSRAPMLWDKRPEPRPAACTAVNSPMRDSEYDEFDLDILNDNSLTFSMLGRETGLRKKGGRLLQKQIQERRQSERKIHLDKGVVEEMEGIVGPAREMAAKGLRSVVGIQVQKEMFFGH